MLRHVIAGKWRTLITCPATAADDVEAKAFERRGQKRRIDCWDRKWFLPPLVKLHWEQSITVNVKVSACRISHNAPSQLRRIVNPHLVVSPLLNPSFGRFGNTGGDATNLLNTPSLEPIWASHDTLRKVAYEYGCHNVRCSVVSPAVIAASKSRNISASPHFNSAIFCAVGFARSGKKPIQRGNISMQAAQ